VTAAHCSGILGVEEVHHLDGTASSIAEGAGSTGVVRKREVDGFDCIYIYALLACFQAIIVHRSAESKFLIHDRLKPK
jgi:hypothetical protein